MDRPLVGGACGLLMLVLGTSVDRGRDLLPAMAPAWLDVLSDVSGTSPYWWLGAAHEGGSAIPSEVVG